MEEIKKFNEFTELALKPKIVTAEISSTDCRDDNGVTVGLIDGIISICRVLKDKISNDSDIMSALKDLQDDEDLKFLLNYSDQPIQAAGS